MTRRYATKQRIALLEETLTPRERAIIDTLDRLRVATTEQLRRICFSDLTSRSAARQAPAILRSLAARQVVVKLERQVGGVRAGSKAAVWSLDTAGQRLASSCGPAGGFHRRRPWSVSLSFLAHRLAVSEVYADLMEAEQAGSVEVLDFDAEPVAWRRYTSAHGGTAYVKPDAFCRVGLGEIERAAFVEIDRATESRSTLTVKLRAYRQYWETGREQERRGYFPKVVFAVPDEDRKAVLVDLFAKQPEETWPLWQVVLSADLNAALIGGKS
ncbi:MAG: replication-relaxation family protein [Solirubrobacterales bacterium]